MALVGVGAVRVPLVHDAALLVHREHGVARVVPDLKHRHARVLLAHEQQARLGLAHVQADAHVVLRVGDVLEVQAVLLVVRVFRASELVAPAGNLGAAAGIRLEDHLGILHTGQARLADCLVEQEAGRGVQGRRPVYLVRLDDQVVNERHAGRVPLHDLVGSVVQVRRLINFVDEFVEVGLQVGDLDVEVTRYIYLRAVGQLRVHHFRVDAAGRVDSAGRPDVEHLLGAVRGVVDDNRVLRVVRELDSDDVGRVVVVDVHNVVYDHLLCLLQVAPRRLGCIHICVCKRVCTTGLLAEFRIRNTTRHD